MPARSLSKAALFVGAMLLPLQAQAQSILCIEGQSIGFVWENEAWAQNSFPLKKHILSKVNEFDDLFVDSVCFDALRKLGKQTTKFSIDDDTVGQWGCYRMKEFGSGYASPMQCLEKFKPKSKLFSLDCEGGGNKLTC